MEPIGNAVRRELARFGPPGGMPDVVAAWRRAAGDLIARNACPARFGRDGTLHVAVSSSAWAFELSQLEPELAARLAHLLGEEKPRRLRFAPGPLPEPSAEDVKHARRETVRPSADDVVRAERVAAQITDRRLRELVRRAAAASLAADSDDRSL